MWPFGESSNTKTEAPAVSEKVFEGKEIREVWDWRLSKGNPILYCDGGHWVIRIWANDGSGLLREIKTKIPSNGNPHDHKAVAECYKILYEIRDEFSRPNIEILKPDVAKINRINARLAHAYKEE